MHGLTFDPGQRRVLLLVKVKNKTKNIFLPKSQNIIFCSKKILFLPIRIANEVCAILLHVAQSLNYILTIHYFQLYCFTKKGFEL